MSNNAFTIAQLETLSRQELRTLSKSHGVGLGNKKNIEMINALKPFATDYNTDASSSTQTSDVRSSRAAGKKRARLHGPHDDVDTEITRWLGSISFGDLIPTFIEEGLAEDWNLVERLQYEHLRGMGLTIGRVLKFEQAIDERWGVPAPRHRIKSLEHAVYSLDSTINAFKSNLTDELNQTVGKLSSEIKELEENGAKLEQNINRMESKVAAMNQRPTLSYDEVDVISTRTVDHWKKETHYPSEAAKMRIRRHRPAFIAFPF